MRTACAWDGHQLAGDSVEISEHEQVCPDHLKMFNAAVARLRENG